MKYTNLLLLVLIASLALTIKTVAQEDDVDPREKIQAKKVAFLTDRLNLTVDEAQKFWPVYNEHETEVDKIHEGRKAVMKKINHDSETLSDDELSKLVDQLVDYDMDEAKIHKAYYEDVKKILPIKKVIKLLKAEREFKQTLLKEFKGHGHGGPGGPGGGRGPCMEVPE